MLLVNRELGITNNVDEENVRDLELNFFLNFGGHAHSAWALGTSASTSFFRRGRLGEFLETRIEGAAGRSK